MHCELCMQDGGEVLHRTSSWRIVLVDDADYPGFCRVIWNDHVREMTDLAPSERALLMEQVWQVEAAVRAVMQPDKINLASLGNVVPHLHWHVIPRYQDDRHFPAPIWSEAKRPAAQATLAERIARLPVLRESIIQHIKDHLLC